MQNTNNNLSITGRVKAVLGGMGFALCGVTDAGAIGEQEQVLLRQWIDSGYCADMNYMRKNFEKRVNPAKLLEGAKSVICVGFHYKSPHDGGGAGHFASYAMHEDYHKFIKDKLFAAVAIIKGFAGDFRFKVCVDSAPVAERSLANRAGLGFIGKNHLLINPQFGCKILLGEIITDLELDRDNPIASQCSGCGKCVQACPGGALREDGMLDAKKCISYLTIEHSGEIPAELKAKFGGSIFGCDRCIRACPFEQNAPANTNDGFAFRHDIAALRREEILAMDAKAFEQVFSNTAIYRTGLAKLKANAAL